MMRDTDAEQIIRSELLDTVAMRRALRQHLPSVEQIGKRIREGLDARKTMLAQFEGEFTDARHMVDFHERRKFAELASRLHGLLALDESGDILNCSMRSRRSWKCKARDRCKI